MHDILDPDVDRKPDGSERVGGQACGAQVRQALPIDIPLHAREAAIVDIDMAQDVLDDGESTDVADLAETIIETQQVEIDLMRDLLADR